MNHTTLRIDIISDIVCPWCIIGYKRLEKALTTISGTVKADIHWHPFQLNPHITQGGENLRSHLAEKYGTTLEGSVEARARLTHMGAELGFLFDYFDEMKTFNTFKAHQLLYHAHQQNKETAMQLRLFAAFFGERKEVDRIETLTYEASAVGLNGEQVRTLLLDERYAEPVRQEQEQWIARGVQAVPTFVFNQTHAASGAQPPEALVDMVQQTL